SAAAGTTLTLTEGVAHPHAAGVAVILQVPLLRAHARYEGQWGNEVRVSARPASLLSTRVTGDAAVGEPITVETTFGLYPGSVLELPDGTRQRVTDVDVARNEVTLEGGLAVALELDDRVASVEFDLVVERVENGLVV